MKQENEFNWNNEKLTDHKMEALRRFNEKEARLFVIRKDTNDIVNYEIEIDWINAMIKDIEAIP